MINNIADIKNLEDVKNRFWTKVDIGSKNECWNWKSSAIRAGYGVLKINDKSESSHRISYILNYGEIPINLLVLHKCDNKICVNPNHLFLGNHQENMKDMRVKGRSAKGDKSGARLHPETVKRGEKVALSKVNEFQIIDMLKLYFDDKIHPLIIIAKYNFDRSSFYKLLSGQLWKHVTDKIYPNGIPAYRYKFPNR